MNIIQHITSYLATNRRLVIPQLGALIRKSEGSEIVFSEILKRDDGVLRGLLEQEGMGELEAAGAINRFVFEIRHTIESGAVYRAEGLGLFALGGNGAIRFRHLPQATSETAPTAPATEQPAEPTPPSQPASEPTAPALPTSDEVEPTLPATPNEQAAEESHEAEKTRRRIKELMRFESEHPRENRSSSHPHRDPSLRNLSYGKPQKSTDAYTYVGSAPSRRPDKFIILAIAAVVIALGAILYGYLKDRRQQRIEQEYLEQIVGPEHLMGNE